MLPVAGRRANVYRPGVNKHLRLLLMDVVLPKAATSAVSASSVSSVAPACSTFIISSGSVVIFFRRINGVVKCVVRARFGEIESFTVRSKK